VPGLPVLKNAPVVFAVEVSVTGIRKESRITFSKLSSRPVATQIAGSLVPVSG
jgi:hypothetical protein